MVKRLACAIGAGALCAAPAFADCRQALVLGLDVSASVDATDYRLQTDGLMAALNDPEVRDLILTQPEAPLHLSVFEWSGSPNPPRLVVEVTAVTDASVLDGIIATLGMAPDREMAGSTGIGAAMLAGLELLRESPECWRKTIDLSGDGQSNVGPVPQDVNVPVGVTINGLVIGGMIRPGDERLMDIKELSTYYRVNVIRGPDAFVETALGFADFQAAMTRKLIRELQGAPVGLAPAPPNPVQVAVLGQ